MIIFCKKYTSTGSTRLQCLLFILCIYLKRIAARDPGIKTFEEIEEKCGTPSFKNLTKYHATHTKSLVYSELIAEPNEYRKDLHCPLDGIIEKACRKIVYKNIKLLSDCPYDNGDEPCNLRDFLYEVVRNISVIWLKDGEILHRPNGNHIEYTDDGHKTLSLFNLGPSDSGEYECLADYTQVDPRAYVLWKFHKSARFPLIVSSVYGRAQENIPMITTRRPLILTTTTTTSTTSNSTVLANNSSNIISTQQKVTINTTLTTELPQNYTTTSESHFNPKQIVDGHNLYLIVTIFVLFVITIIVLVFQQTYHSVPKKEDVFSTLASTQKTSSETTTISPYDQLTSVKIENPSTKSSDVWVDEHSIENPIYGVIGPRNSQNANIDWTFPRRNLERMDKIGEGQFGEVWRYIKRSKQGHESIVAVKQLKYRVGQTDRERLELIAEIEIMKSVNDHPNVIKLLHYCVDESLPVLLIMEFADKGKLQTYLRSCRDLGKRYESSFYGSPSSSSNLDRADVVSSSGCSSGPSTPKASDKHEEPNPKITSRELVRFAYHISIGMEYVASQGIIHRDIASRNILVSKELICKVADFGFARRVTDDEAYERSTASPVPVKWMAPEALVENKFTFKSDVFSFGILLWEIVTLGATPYEYLSSSEVYKKVTSGDRLEKPPHCKDDFFKIMSQCWHQDPTQRPTFKELALKLEKLLATENNYIELDQYPKHAYYNIINMAEKEVIGENDKND